MEIKELFQGRRLVQQTLQGSGWAIHVIQENFSQYRKGFMAFTDHTLLYIIIFHVDQSRSTKLS